MSGVLLTKLPNAESSEQLTIQLSLADLFIGKALEGLGPNSEVQVHSSRITRDITNFFSLMFGDVAKEVLGTDAEAKKGMKIGDYFGKKIENWLEFLRDGDSLSFKPSIEAFERVSEDSLGCPVFSVQLIRQKYIDVYKANIVDAIQFQEVAFQLLGSSVDLSEPTIAIEKQLDFLRQYLNSRNSVTGEATFAFRLSDFNSRKAMLAFDGPDGAGVMPTPLSSGANIKALLPFVLALKGELDIDQVKIVSDAPNIDAVDIQFSIRRPAVRNILAATYCSLPAEKRALMSESEIKVYEDAVKELQANLAFAGKPKLEAQFAELSAWIIRQVAYCLQEPSFLQSPARAWRQENAARGYEGMEDGFFLPFLYERLREKFGPLATKKPERFGGNVDILFGDIPLELKVRKDQRAALVDTVVDETYKPTGQAAAYAALTGLGCVAVLDLPSNTPSVTNLSACVKVVTRRFAEAKSPTSIVVFVFQCDTPRPSAAN